MRRFLMGDFMESDAGQRTALILLFIVPAFFSTNMLMAKATADFIPPVALAFGRWLLAFVILLPLAGPGLWANRRILLKESFDLLILGALGMGVCGAFVYIAADTTTATNIGLIYAASPVMILVLAHFFLKERMNRQQLLGVLIALSGVLVIITKADFHVLLALDFVAGDVWIVAAALGWAAYSILLKSRPSQLDQLTRFAAISLGGVIVLAPFHIWEVMEGHVARYDLVTLGSFAILAIIPSLGAYQAYGLIQRALGAGKTGLLLYLSPVYTAGLAALFLGEEIALYHIIGAVLVLPGLLISTKG